MVPTRLAEMRRTFARQRRETSGIAVAGLWIATLVDVLVNATRVHGDLLRQDLRQTARSLRRAPGFATTAVLITALGVGATTAAFTLTDHVLLTINPF